MSDNIKNELRIRNDEKTENPLIKDNTEIVEYSSDTYGDSEQDAEFEKPYKVKAIRAVSRVSACLQETWYCFEFSETREILDDSKISEVRADLWNTVNNEVDNQVQYTIDSILGKVNTAVPQQPQTQSNIPPQYDY